MAAKASFRERQIEEIVAIKSIFGSDVEDLRPNSSDVPAAQWRPTDVRIQLTPLRDSSNGQTEAYVRTKLHIICPSKYPKVAPIISLEESKGISDQLIEELLQQLQQQAQNLCGEVMIYQLAQIVQNFLLQHNKPPGGSFYDQMVEGKQKRKQEKKEQINEKEKRDLQIMFDEVQRRKEMLNVESKRREPRLSMSESKCHLSSSESSESSAQYYLGQFNPNKCFEHRNSDTLHFHKVGRQINRGSCLGHSRRGSISYTGIDLETGQLLYITEWNITHAQLQRNCQNGGKCFWIPTISKCDGSHNIDDFIASLEKQVAALSLLNHKNLLRYECVHCIKRKEGLLVYLVQDFLHGASVLNISSSLGWCLDGVRMIARGVLDALIYLHNNGVSHSYLLDSTVFVDKCGVIRCSDFSVVPHLIELIAGPGQRSTHGDIPALGTLIKGLMPAQTCEMRDFIDKCNSERTLSASELLEHYFLKEDTANFTNALSQPKASMAVASLCTTYANLNTTGGPLIQKIGVTPPVPSSLIPTSQSRLSTEFDMLKYLGKGAFGDVLKVRNILDNREYAIKRIPLPARSRQLYKKMTREVELLSRLNHENVVRYFNSWIESATAQDMEEMDKLISGDFSASQDKSIIKSPSPSLDVAVKDSEESTTSLWKGFMPGDSDSDGIEFVDSNGEVAVYDNDEDDVLDDMKRVKSASPKPPMQVMYIQMEFCEKCTLRTAIDGNLYEDRDRLWRLFREIAEGLSHIHQQGIIHRDLKPVNIFLDANDQIKIGDFGLATTSFLALQSQYEISNLSQIVSTEEGTGTGNVGTTLYVAPELTGTASKSTYSQKVDMYTLGIILFEMSHPKFGTAMERVKTIMALRAPTINIPEAMLNDSKQGKTVQIIRWLLKHDPAARPTAEELLASGLVPPAQVEPNELQEMIRHALANPQSKSYRYLVARCLQQQSDEILEHTYHEGSSRTMISWNTPRTLDALVSLNPIMENVKAKVVRLFRMHGAIEVDTPLLSPLSKYTNLWPNPVRLMTHSGCVVVLPTELRTDFARYIAMSGINMIRRYSVDRIYQEEKVVNFHPKQNYECAFDIITPNTSGQLVDAELLLLAFEIASEIPRLREKNLIIRLNHTNLLRAILLYCNVPKNMYKEVFANFQDFSEGRFNKFQLKTNLTVIMKSTRSSATALIDLLTASFPMSGSRSSVDDSSLKSLVRGKGEAASLAKDALSEMESIVAQAQGFGVTCPIHVFAGLSINYDHAISGGIIWQMVADLNSNRDARPAVIATGGRYDSKLHEFQKQAQSNHSNAPNRNISGVGLSFALDKLVAAIGPDYERECRAVDVGVYVFGSRPSLKHVTLIMRLLWSNGIRCCIVEPGTISSGVEEVHDLTILGALHLILVSENGELRVRSFDNGRLQDRTVNHKELVEFIRKIRSDSSNSTAISYATQSSMSGNVNVASGGRGGDYNLSTSASSSSIHTSLGQLPSMQIIYLTQEKYSNNYRRRCENQVTTEMSSTLAQFVKKETFIVIVVELPPNIVNAIVGAINPRASNKTETDAEIVKVIERFPNSKRYINLIYREILKFLTDAKSSIVALFSVPDPYYRVIM